MKIAYLVNQYPKTSHSFIRREIVGLEACGIPVTRFSIRSLQSELVDEADQQEFEKTRYILGEGAIRLLTALLHVALTRPLRVLQTAWLALTVGWKSDRGVLLHLVYLVEACVLLHWCLEASIDHIHVHFGTNSATVAMLCQGLGGPAYSFTVHGPEEFDKPDAIALTQKIQRAAFVVAVSSFGKSQLSRWCGYKQWSKIHIVRCGVDELFLAQTGVPIPKQPRFVCVGRLSEQKGHLLLIEAASQLAAEGLQFKLVLVGDGPLRSQIETLITHLNLENHIEITGWASNEEVKRQMLAAQAMVMPSFAEGLPVVIMEALALARPVISTYIAGIPELVESDKCGWLVPSGSVEELVAAMRTALQTPVETLEQMGKAGVERVARYHNATQEASQLATLIESYCRP
ncbi:MAG: glycosyltransferase family 4 protein [Leptolyngbyaceae cyanobacterium RU_5_1]|nr:glycosyltransferase family 4 protein [Leptolyngbyaceae cyanobacterium RU_5_1]